MKIAFLSSRAEAAMASREELTARYGSVAPDDADVLVALGGDGFMIETLHALSGLGKPVYGMNRGTVGFLMNPYEPDGLPEAIAQARSQAIHPLRMQAEDIYGDTHVAHAFNDVSLLRASAQAANISIAVDGTVHMEHLICDGIILSTPAGSTAYNFSAYGPILPLDANVLALTPIAAFRPRRWRGAVLPSHASVTFRILGSNKRPVSVSADSQSFRNIAEVTVELDRSRSYELLFDPGHSLEDRILREQFS